MRTRTFVMTCAAAANSTLALMALAGIAVTHWGRNVGDCEIVVGFLREPPVEGQPNGALVRISRVAESMQSMSGADGVYG